MPPRSDLELTNTPAFPSLRNGSPIVNVLVQLQKVKPTGRDKWQACCPAHEDKQASLSLTIGNNGGVLMNCFAGCTFDAILTALRLTRRDLYPEDIEHVAGRATGRSKGRGTDLGQIVATYDYVDEAGKLLYQVVRYDPKKFRQRRPDGAGGWIWDLKDVRRVLYRRPEVLAAVQRGELILLPEGEKDCENLRALDINATTNAQGADAPFLASYAEALRGADVVILPDNDEAGRMCRDNRTKALMKTAKRVRVLELPDLPYKGDISDWLKAGGTKEELLRLIENAPDVSPLDAEMQGVLSGLSEALKGLPITVEANGLPTLAENAKISDVTSAIYKADKFGKRANVVVNLFIGALATQAGSVRNALKNWTERAFGKDENMRDHVARCKQAYMAWRGVYDVNKHDWCWSTLLLGSRQIFSHSDRREMVDRAKAPTGPELETEIERRKMAQNKDGALTPKPPAQFQKLMKAYRESKGEEKAAALYRQFNDMLIAEMGIEDDPEETVSEAEYGGCIKETYTSLTYPSVHPAQPQSVPETPPITGDIPSDSTADWSDDEDEFADARALVELAFCRQQEEEATQAEQEEEADRWKSLGISSLRVVPLIANDPLKPFAPVLAALEAQTLPRSRVTLPDGADVMNLSNYVEQQQREYRREPLHRARALAELALCEAWYEANGRVPSDTLVLSEGTCAKEGQKRVKERSLSE